MPDIGATLREARMRQRVDISDIEAQTKIRAKYLRALENEEWDLLPGPTYVKTFLRTYAEALGLDARLLLEEYKLRYERLPEHEVMPISPKTARQRERGGRRGGPSIGRDVLVAALVVGLVGLLIVLGRGGGDSPGTQAGNTVATTPKPDPARTTQASAPASRTTRPQTVRLQLVPHASVWVCLRDADKNKTLMVGSLTGSSTTQTFRSKRFTMTLGNGSVDLRVDGKTFNVPPASDAIGYAISPKGRTKLSAATRPSCA
jgi:cytoskeleton protein RodZ